MWTLLLKLASSRYFELWVFLALDNVFSYYNKNIQRNQNKVINDKNVVFQFNCVIGEQYNSGRTSNLNY